jgi:hypothetical protein
MAPHGGVSCGKYPMIGCSLIAIVFLLEEF